MANEKLDGLISVFEVVVDGEDSGTELERNGLLFGMMSEMQRSY